MKLGTIDIETAYFGRIPLTQDNFFLGKTPIIENSEPVEHQIIISNPTGCTISSNLETAYAGDTVTLSISVQTGYQFLCYLVNGEINNNGIFTMPDGDVTVTASVARQQYRLRVYPTPVNGIVYTTPNNNAYYGDYVEIHVTPAPGCEVDTIFVTTYGYISGTDFIMPDANVDVSVTFKQIASPPMNFVNLGLPSDTKWGQYDYGVDSDNLSTKSDYIGNLYAWGETEPKQQYLQSNYKFGSDPTAYTKYTTVDNLEQLVGEDDPVNSEYSHDYYTASYAEFYELVNNIGENKLLSAIEVFDFNNIPGLNGMKIYNNEDPNLFIFLPYEGSSTSAKYWTSSREGLLGKGLGEEYNGSAFSVEFGSVSNTDNTDDKYLGFRVRPIIRNPNYTSWWSSGKSIDNDNGKQPINYDDDYGKSYSGD